MTTKLYKLAESNSTVDSILRAATNHVQATDELNARGFDFGRTSVRRAREEMGVRSPQSTTAVDNVVPLRRDQELFTAPQYQEPKPQYDFDKDSTFVVLPDWQCDLQDDSFLWRVLDLVHDVQPDGIVHVGDENDATSISRWTMGTPEEHVPDQLQRQVDITYQWMKRFRDVESVQRFDVCYSNHGHRFGQSLRTKVPGWKDMRVVQYKHIMREAAEFHGNEELDINWDVHVVDMIPGTLAGHGDQWNLTSKAQYSQMSNVSLENSKNIVAGHTHRPLLSTAPYRDADGVQQSRFIMNVGHAMDITKADYTSHYRGKTPNWGQAVGIITVIDGVAYPQLVQDHNGSMLFEGRLY